MKTIVATAVLVAALSSPVMAQQYQTWEPRMGEPIAQAWQDPGMAFARSNGVIAQPRSSNPAYDVYDSTGEYLGSDPDPLVRSQLATDPPGRGD